MLRPYMNDTMNDVIKEHGNPHHSSMHLPNMVCISLSCVVRTYLGLFGLLIDLVHKFYSAFAISYITSSLVMQHPLVSGS